MQLLKDLEIGVMFWAGRDPGETLRELKSLGVRCGQMGIPGDMPLEGAAGPWKRALEDENYGSNSFRSLLWRELCGYSHGAAHGGLRAAGHACGTRSPHPGGQ